jgi:hypothetical protein
MKSSGEVKQALEVDVSACWGGIGCDLDYSNSIRFDLSVGVAVRHIEGGGNK